MGDKTLRFTLEIQYPRWLKEDENGEWVRYEDVAHLLVEGQKPPTNSDYAAALRVFEEYVAAKDKRGDSVIDFPIWLGQCLNAAKAPHCA